MMGGSVADVFLRPLLRESVENQAQSRLYPESSLFLYVPVGQLLLSKTTGVSGRDHRQVKLQRPLPDGSTRRVPKEECRTCAAFRLQAALAVLVISPVTNLLFQASGGPCPKQFHHLTTDHHQIGGESW